MARNAIRSAVAATLLVAALFVCAAAGAIASGKIKHIVVLMEENRSFDHMLGLFNGTDRGTRGKRFSNNVTYYDPKTGRNVTKEVVWRGGAPYINYCDPDHGLPPTTYKIFGTDHPAADANETMSGFAQFEFTRHDDNAKLDECNVMQGFTPDKLPVMTSLAENFVLMDNFFCSVPGPTWPNRIFFMAGTSDGLTETGPWYKGEVGKLFPGRTIFDQVADAGGTWKVYYDDTPWELFMETLAHQPEHLQQMANFYADAAAGTLPTFSFINPRAGVNLTQNVGSNDMHPDHDVALGEALYRDVYQALRHSPSWNETLFVLTFDEHGGFWDHVPPPRDIPAPGGSVKSYPDEFDFTRGGIRIPTILISPWLPKGATVSDPTPAQKPAANSAFELTSIMASARKLLGMDTTPALTERDAWAATFDDLFDLLPEPRTDCPEQLPLPPPPAGHAQLEAEAAMPINPLQQHIMAVHANVIGEPFPSHVQRQGDVEAYVSAAFAEHKQRTLRWRATKALSQSAPSVPKHVDGRPAIAKVAALDVGAAPGRDARYELAVQAELDHHDHGRSWHITTANGTASVTLSMKHHETLWCMDGGAMDNGTFVGVSACYPSADPVLNRDPSQQWVRPSDATIRPANNTDLCITNTALEPVGGSHLFLAPCDGRLQQHYSWQGAGVVQPGAGAGVMYYGDALMVIVVADRKH